MIQAPIERRGQKQDESKDVLVLTIEKVAEYDYIVKANSSDIATTTRCIRSELNSLVQSLLRIKF